jgi:hypothetical protein
VGHLSKKGVNVTKIIWGINIPYKSRCIKHSDSWTSPLEYEPCIRIHKEMFFVLCDICGSQVPPGRVSRGITTCCPKCNAKKWDVKKGLIIKQEKEACGVRPSSFWLTISGECFRRDNFTCRVCGRTREQLECDRKGEPYGTDHILNCHHIKPIKDGGNNQLDNLITLCGKCHKIEHSHDKNLIRKRKLIHKPLIPE